MIIALKGEGVNWFKLQEIMNIAAEKKHTPQSNVCINLFNNYCKQSQHDKISSSLFQKFA